jgi:predicted RND superfamily exporter protein
LQFPKLSVNPNFSDYIPDHITNKKYLKVLDSIFGGSETILIILNSDDILTQQSFDRIQNLTNGFADLEGIERTLSLVDIIDINMDDGFVSMDPLIDEVPTGLDELEELKSKILKNSMGQRFVASDFTSTAIMLTKADDVEDDVIHSSITKVISKNPGNEKIYMGGLSYIRYSISSYIRKDLIVLLPTALVLMILMLYFSFKEWKGVVLPFIVVILSNIFSFAIMSLLGWQISIITVLLPIMLIAIANDYGIHLINRYQEIGQTGEYDSMKNIALRIYRDLRKPILVTGLTTIGGILGLLSHKMIPARQLGILAALGIGFALLMSLFLIPVLLTFYKKPKFVTEQKQHKKALLDKLLTVFSKWVLNYPKKVILVFGAVTLFSVAGLFLLKVDTNIESYFLGKSDIRKGIDLVNNKFGGAHNVSILFRGDILSHELLQRIDNYTEQIKSLPTVGFVTSPTIFLKELSKGFYQPGETRYNKLPETEDEAVQYLEMYSLSGNEEVLSQFLDYNYENARILISTKDGSNRAGKTLMAELKKITADDPDIVCIAGPGFTTIELADLVVRGQISSLLLAMLVIFIMLSIIFKSGAGGAFSSIPLLLSIVMLFGFMGYLGIPLDIATALLSSIMIGVGIDYTIHFLWRYREEFAVTNDRNKSINTTLITTGRGIVFNAFSVIFGFAALILSNFAPLRFFGALVVISIFACLISALLLIPAIIILVKPKFLER